jgi:cell wall assembly regulator SMI1
VKKTPPIRRFVHPDGRWINIAAAEGQVVRFSGTKEGTVPYFGGVTEETFKPRAGRSADEEMEKLAVDFKRRKYAEVLPTKRPTGEIKINGLWRRFENWLCEHTPVFCGWPLAPGASERDLLAFERTIGANLPADARQSYLRHNGSAGVRLLSVVGEGKWVTVKEAARQWKFFQDIRPDLEAGGFLSTPLGPMKEVHISPGWVPISDNSGGDHLCVDLDPAEGGTVGQLFSYWHEYGAWRFVAPSFTAFLEHLLKHLAGGRYAINDQGQLAPVNGPAPESVDQVQDYFLGE